MKDKPVNVGIPYTNEEELKLAIAQAERYGYKEDKVIFKNTTCDCIWLAEDGTFFQCMLEPRDKTIPLERPISQLEKGTPPTPYLGKKNEEMRTFSIAGKTAVTFNAEDYSLEHKGDGTIILKPKKKKKFKVKVWLVAIKDYVGNEVGFEYHTNKNKAEKCFFETKGALEIIEREYEV